MPERLPLRHSPRRYSALLAMSPEPRRIRCRNAAVGSRSRPDLAGRESTGIKLLDDDEWHAQRSRPANDHSGAKVGPHFGIVMTVQGGTRSQAFVYVVLFVNLRLRHFCG